MKHNNLEVTVSAQKSLEEKKLTDQYSSKTRDLGSAIHELRTNNLMENARKARRMLMLYCIVGLIWCQKVIINKVTPGGIEIDGIVGLIPYVIMGLIAYFAWQYHVNLYFDFVRVQIIRDRVRRLFSELTELNDESMINGFIIVTSESEFQIKKYKQENIVNLLQTYVDFFLPSALLLITILFFIDHYYWGWLVETP